jgi:hypothetical protein
MCQKDKEGKMEVDILGTKYNIDFRKEVNDKNITPATESDKRQETMSAMKNTTRQKQSQPRQVLNNKYNPNHEK